MLKLQSKDGTLQYTRWWYIPIFNTSSSLIIIALYQRASYKELTVFFCSYSSSSFWSMFLLLFVLFLCNLCAMLCDLWISVQDSKRRDQNKFTRTNLWCVVLCYLWYIPFSLFVLISHLISMVDDDGDVDDDEMGANQNLLNSTPKLL